MDLVVPRVSSWFLGKIVVEMKLLFDLLESVTRHGISYNRVARFV